MKPTIYNYSCVNNNLTRALQALKSQGEYSAGSRKHNVRSYDIDVRLTHMTYGEVSSLTYAQAELLMQTVNEQYPEAVWVIGAENPMHTINLYQLIDELF